MRSKDDSCTVDEHNKKFIRVVLPDESTTVFYAKPSTTLRAAIAKLCERRNLDLDLIDVYNHSTGKVGQARRRCATQQCYVIRPPASPSLVDSLLCSSNVLLVLERLIDESKREILSVALLPHQFDFCDYVSVMLSVTKHGTRTSPNFLEVSSALFLEPVQYQPVFNRLRNVRSVLVTCC